MRIKQILNLFLILVLVCSFSGCANKTPEEIAAKQGVLQSEKPEISIPSEPNTVEIISSKYLTKDDYTYMTSKNGEVIVDSIDESIPAYIDVISFKKHIDDQDIYLYIELREIPQTLPINQSGLSAYTIEYIWRVSFDTGGDGEIFHDTIINHEKFWTREQPESVEAINSSFFDTKALQQEVRSDYKITECDFEITNNTLIFHVKKESFEELNLIHEDTPFYILTENTTTNNYFNQLVPGK